jgi:hypothetical protein
MATITITELLTLLSIVLRLAQPRSSSLRRPRAAMRGMSEAASLVITIVATSLSLCESDLHANSCARLASPPQRCIDSAL